MTRAKLIAGIALIFFLGALAGALAMQGFYKYDKRGDPRRHLSTAQKVDFIVDRISRDLDLAPDQAAEIRPIVEAGEEEIRAIKDGIDPEIRESHDRVFSAIRERIEPAQQKKLDEMVARIKKFRARSPKDEP